MGNSENCEGPKRHNLKRLVQSNEQIRTNLFFILVHCIYYESYVWLEESLGKFWLISTLCFVLCLANPILEDDSEDSDSIGDEEINAVNLYDYLQRLAASRSSLYENPYMVSDMLRDRRRGSMAENNFQLRVRKDFMDHLRNPPQIRSSAEDNFQLRVRRKPSSAERNFQLRVRRSDPNLSLRQTF